MNYTTLEKVKSVLGAEETTDDSLLETKIVEASRAIDVTICHADPDYFKAASVAGEITNGIITSDGAIVCWVKKAVVTSVTLFEYRLSPRTPWLTVEAAYCTISNKRQVTAWGSGSSRNVKVQIRLSYVGGYGTEVPAVSAVVDPPTARVPATLTGMPEEIVDAATTLTIRFYKEEKSGLTDAIGVAELGTMQYTKAIPVRVVDMCKPYKRIVA
jgi:hypothetical protein